MTNFRILIVCIFFVASRLLAGDAAPRAETWDYAPTVTSIAAKFAGKPGKVVPMGDSITYANQSSRWARSGAGRTKEEEALCTWMHAGENNASNGWWLAADDQPKGRSWTASSGITSGEYIKGGHHGLPALAEILREHKPQIALVLLGTNDVLRGVPAKDYLANMEAIYNACMEAGAVPVVTTITPTTKAKEANIQAYNDGLFAIAQRLKLPFLDLHGEFLRRGPDGSWQQNLVGKDGIHLSVDPAGGPATEENLKKCGYLLKCYTQCQKVLEIKNKMKW